MIPTEGQHWVEKTKGKPVWAISFIRKEMIDDKEAMIIFLKDLDGVECESGYTEKYFYRWFYEIGEPRRKENRTRASTKAVPNLKHWMTTGPVVSKAAKNK